MTPEEHAVKLREEGASYSTISAKTGLTEKRARRAVYAAMGKTPPRRDAAPGAIRRRGQSPERAARVAMVLELYRGGMGPRAIARKTGISEQTIKTYCEESRNPPIDAVKKTPRPCICCGATFLSEGIGHRMCYPCRAGERPYDGRVVDGAVAMAIASGRTPMMRTEGRQGAKR